MSEVFIKIFNLGLTAGWLVLAILLCRPLMKRAPKWINCLLWGIVGLRLCLPFSLESVFSLIPSAEPLPSDIMMSPAPEINSGVGVLNNAVNPIISTTLAPEVGASVNPMQVIIEIAAWIWIIGIALMLGYGALSYISLRLKVRASVKGEDKVYFCDEVDSPFILGVIRPRIYVPSGMKGEELDHVLAHERAHLRRCDHLWKPIAFTVLAFYWFNPLLWVAYALLCRDIESACDEEVIKTMSAEAKKSYSEALLACSLHRKRIMACPLAFGEVGVKQRIKSVLNYKKPAFWVIIAALIATLILSVCFLTNPQSNVRELLEPGSQWRYDGDITLSVTVDGRVGMEGLLFGDNLFDEIVIRYRNDGRKIRAYVLKAEIEDIKYDSKGDLVSNIEYNEWRDSLEAEHLLFSGILTARGDDVVLKIDQDNIGIGSKRLILERTNDFSSNYPQTVQDANGNYIRITDSGSDQKELDASLIWAKRDGNDIVFWLKWKNKSLKNRSIGKSFNIYRYEGVNKLVPLDCVGAWPEVAMKVSRSVSYMRYDITEHYNISVPGKYRFESDGAWVEFEVIEDTYLGLDASNGLDVIVWQMAQRGYSFALIPHSEENHGKLFYERDILKSGVNASEMREILSTYDVSEEDIHIVPWQNPISSYIADYYSHWAAIEDITPYQEMYIAIIRDMILGESLRGSYPNIYESKSFDVDGDGENEFNQVCHGLVNGKFMFSYVISDDGKTASYFDTFYTEPMWLQFVTSADGKVRLHGKTENGEVKIFDISIKDGHVKLTENKDAIGYFDVAHSRLKLSEADYSMINEIMINYETPGNKKWLEHFQIDDLIKILCEVEATDPVSVGGYYGRGYAIEMYHDHDQIYSFAIVADDDGAYLVCGISEGFSHFTSAYKYKLANSTYEKLLEVLGNYVK